MEGAAERGRESGREGPVRSVRSEGHVGDNGGRHQERKESNQTLTEMEGVQVVVGGKSLPRGHMPVSA